MKIADFIILMFCSMAVIAVSNCAITTGDKQRLNLVRLNMSKLEVARTMGREGQAHASETTADGKLQEIWIYEFSDLLGDKSENFRLIFIDDKLVKWSKK
jgi:hypothetical protein